MKKRDGKTRQCPDDGADQTAPNKPRGLKKELTYLANENFELEHLRRSDILFTVNQLSHSVEILELIINRLKRHLYCAKPSLNELQHPLDAAKENQQAGKKPTNNSKQPLNECRKDTAVSHPDTNQKPILH